MITEKDRLTNDLKVAANFLRSITTGRVKLDLELSELASRIEKIASEQDANGKMLSAGQNNVNAA
jgi:hypothetical protein